MKKIRIELFSKDFIGLESRVEVYLRPCQTPIMYVLAKIGQSIQVWTKRIF